MTESIQRNIQQISNKVSALHANLLFERKKNTELLAEIESLKASLFEKNDELSSKNLQIQELNNQLVGLQEQNTASLSGSSLNHSNEIDELVKEIEYCISQLRK